jgi:Bacterial cell division membrane protein
MFNFSRENTGKIAKWWRNVDKEILISFLFLFLLGLFFSFSSTSSVVGEKMNKQTYYFFNKHLIFVCISLFLLVAISIQDKKTLIKILPYIFFISLLFLFLLPLFGVEVKGSKRWMEIPFLPRFQPVELVKPNVYNFYCKNYNF